MAAEFLRNEYRDLLLLLLEDPSQQALFPTAGRTGDGDESARILGKPPFHILFRFYTVCPGVLSYGIEV